MIPQAYIIEWSSHVPWKTNEQVEQDLVISRALVEIYNDDLLAQHLAFRGGTALHKLFLQPQYRYSEDLDFVQISAEPIGEILDHLRSALAFLGKGKVEVGDTMAVIKYRFDSEVPPIVPLRLKIETNCREHFAVLGWHTMRFEVNSSWFSGSCDLTTYKIEELLGTKIRALYQRKKGRDLYDLYHALTKMKMDLDEVIKCYKKYMEFSVGKPPSQKEFLMNIEEKLQDGYFIGDITGLIRPTEVYDQGAAYELVREKLILRM